MWSLLYSYSYLFYTNVSDLEGETPKKGFSWLAQKTQISCAANWNFNLHVSTVSDCTAQIVSEPERKLPKAFLVTGSKYTAIMTQISFAAN